jgi:hypothetical protein
LITRLRNGFDIIPGDTRTVEGVYECWNLQSAREGPETLENVLSSVIQKGFIKGSFKQHVKLGFNFSHSEVFKEETSYISHHHIIQKKKILMASSIKRNVH